FFFFCFFLLSLTNAIKTRNDGGGSIRREIDSGKSRRDRLFWGVNRKGPRVLTRNRGHGCDIWRVVENALKIAATSFGIHFLAAVGIDESTKSKIGNTTCHTLIILT